MRSRAMVLGLLTSGCAAIAIGTAPAKVATAQTASGKAVAERFWSALHEGRYDAIDGLVEEHLQVALEQPGDAVTVSHLGWLHVWALAERARTPPAAAATEHIALSRRYFEEAVSLDPTEARYLGFLASLTMAEGAIFQNEARTRAGYYLMKDAVAAWPEFNLFTSGYTVSNTPVDRTPFREGLEQQWQTLEVCFGSRAVPTPSGFDATRETHEGHGRACWNSWIAPHNFEGFFLNFGDMLVRAGDVTNARAIYEAAKLSKTYDQWPYRAVLERRLASIDGLGARFATAQRGEPEQITMFDSAFSCMACHQGSGAPSVP